MKHIQPLLLALFILASACLNAQPLNLDTAVKPVELKLIKFNPKGQPRGKGLINITKVTQVRDTSYYFCKGLSIYSPASVVVASADKAIPLEVSLHKWNWKETSRSGQTNEKGVWAEKFRTENDFGIRVVAPQRPAAYTLTVWVGDEADPEIPSEFKDMDAEAGSGGGSFIKKYGLYLLIGILGLAVIVLLVKRKK